MRRLLVVAVLLTAPSIAWADDPGIQPGQMSAEFNRLYRYAGCAEDFRSCSTVDMRVQVIPGSYQPGREAWISFEHFQGVWFDGTTDPYQLYGSGSMAGECYLGGFGVASSTLTGTFDADNGGCGRSHPDDWTPAPSAIMRATIVLNPTSQSFTNYTYTMYQVPITTTPEPASIVLMGSGLVGLLAVRRRRLQTQQR